jgi:hypothetical protein
MSSLWRGDDHLVYVRGSGFLLPFTEEYKRYRFQDIQVISVAKKSRIGKSILYGMGMLFCALPVILILLLAEDSFSPVSAVFASIFALGFLLAASFLIRHLVLGPTCTCDIQTALSRDRIRPLNRYFKTREVISLMEGDVRSAQVDFLSSSSKAAETETRTASPNSLAAFAVPAVATPTFLASMLFALGCLGAIHLESVALIGFLLVMILIVAILLLFTLIASVRKATPESIRTVLWVLLGLLFVFISKAVVYLLVAVTRDPAYTIGFLGPLEAFAGVATEGGLVFYLIFLCLSAGLFASGLAGLLQTGKWKSKIAAGARVKVEQEEAGDG